MKGKPEKPCENAFIERVRFFSHDYLRCCMYLAESGSGPYSFTKPLYSKLITSSHLLEDCLDFHGAKNNSLWYFYRELAATVRHISLAGYAQKHISNRLFSYDIDRKNEFRKQGDFVLEFLMSSLAKLAPVILGEARKLEIALPERGFNAGHFLGISSGDMLPCDFEDEDRDDYKTHIVRVANEFLSIAANFDTYEFFEVYDQEELKHLVPSRVNEVEIRRFEMLVHNLQSSFDTYVIHGGSLHARPILNRFRAYFSVIYHLLQVMGRLLHFYERHQVKVSHKSSYESARERLCELVNPDMLLDCTINFGLYWVNLYFSTGREVADQILQENVRRSAITVSVPQDLGFHCRPSLLVAKIVQNYGGQVDLVIGDDRFDARSVLDIQWAGGKIQKENIKQVRFEGDVRALRDIEILSRVNYGEDRMGKGIPLPRSLHYLR
jgi:phosphotransferase system HPr-like phosphotransfer protein